ncbi:hypothetical protein [Corticicoccus populi]|uniref:Uncharacterized protein n=1 Tax=Corticicoccus populi TaxID=1812821 RepID=A0ABW5WZ63_9STAP
MKELYILSVSSYGGSTAPAFNLMDMSVLLEFAVIVLSVGTLIYVISKNRQISVLSIPVIYLIVSLINMNYPSGLIVLFSLMILQTLILYAVEMYEKNRAAGMEDL